MIKKNVLSKCCHANVFVPSDRFAQHGQLCVECGHPCDTIEGDGLDDYDGARIANIFAVEADKDAAAPDWNKHTDAWRQYVTRVLFNHHHFTVTKDIETNDKICITLPDTGAQAWGYSFSLTAAIALIRNRRLELLPTVAKKPAAAPEPPSVPVHESPCPSTPTTPRTAADALRDLTEGLRAIIKQIAEANNIERKNP